MSIRDAAGYLSALMTCVKEDSKFVLVCADGRVWCVLMGGWCVLMGGWCVCADGRVWCVLMGGCGVC